MARLISSESSAVPEMSARRRHGRADIECRAGYQAELEPVPAGHQLGRAHRKSGHGRHDYPISGASRNPSGTEGEISKRVTMTVREADPSGRLRSSSCSEDGSLKSKLLSTTFE